MKKILYSILVVMMIGVAFLPVAQAVDLDPGLGNVPSAGIKDYNSLLGAARGIIKILYTVFYILAAVFVLYAGYLYLTASSGGKAEENLKKAKNSLLYGAIAVTIALLSTSFSAIIQNIVTTQK